MASVVLAGLSLVAIVVVAAVGNRLLAALANRTAEPTAETILTSGKSIFMILVTGAIVVAVFRYDPGSAVARVTSIQATGVVVNAAAYAVTAAATLRVSRRMLRPAVERLRPGELSVPQRFTRLSMAGYFALQFALGLAVVARLYGLVSYSLLSLLPLVLVAVILNSALERPLTVPKIGLLYARDPTEDERRRIERCYERFGRVPGRIVVSAMENDVGVTAVGRGPFRTVALTEPFLERLDDDELAVVLAQADERARRYHGVYPLLFLVSLIFTACSVLVFLVNVLLLGGIGVGRFLGGLVLGPVEIGVALALSILGMVAVATRAKKTAYRADEFVVAQFGSETVGDVYREFGDSLWDAEPDEDKKQLLSPVPKRSVRLARIGVESDSSDDDSEVTETADDWTVRDDAEGDEPDETAVEPSEPTESADTDLDAQSSPEEDASERDWSWSDAGTE